MILIDAEDFKKRLFEIAINGGDLTWEEFYKVSSVLDSQPAAYNADKIVEQLEEQKNQYFRRAEEIKNKFGENYESQKNYGKACSYDHAIEIVKSGGIE